MTASHTSRCEKAVRNVLAAAATPLTWFEIVKHPEWDTRPGAAAPLFRVLFAGVDSGWLTRTVADNTTRFALTDGEAAA